MGNNLSSGSMTVNNQIQITGGLPIPATGQTDLSLYNMQVNTGTGISRAVTAGKTTWVYSLHYTIGTVGGTATTGGVEIRDNGTTLLARNFLTNGEIIFPKPLKITHTLQVVFTALGATDRCYMTLNGVEQ